jgi:hypothetical protein
MTIMIFVQCFIAGLLGIFWHMLMKIKGLRSRAIAANQNFSFSAYFQKDWFSILISVVSVAIAIYILDELLHFKPGLADWTKAFFIAVGFMGDSVLQSLLSKSEKQILDIIDKKTNVADSVLNGNVPTDKEAEAVTSAQAAFDVIGDGTRPTKGPK